MRPHQQPRGPPGIGVCMEKGEGSNEASDSSGNGRTPKFSHPQRGSPAEPGRSWEGFLPPGTESLKGLGFSVPQAGNGSKIQQGGAEGDREEKGQIKEGQGHRARRS